MENNEQKEISAVLKKKLGEMQINNSMSVERVNEEKITKVLTINANPIVENV